MKTLMFGSAGAVTVVFSAILAIKSLISPPETSTAPLLATVEKKDFEFSILEQGTVESSQKVEIISEVGTSRWEGIPLLSIVKEGTPVKPGMVVAVLDSSNIELQLKQQEIAVNTAKSKLQTEISNYQSALEEKEEYFDDNGVLKRDMTKALNAKAKTATTLEQAKQYLEFSKVLLDKGFISGIQYKQDESTFEEAELADKLARIEIKLLERGMARKKIDFDAKIAAAKVAKENARTNLEIDTKELRKIEEMKDNCKILVPEGVEGKVVYPDRYDHYTDKKVVMEPGTKISAKQSVALIPNPKYMQVNGKVSESRIVHVDEDQEVEIKLDARSGESLKGRVKSVSQFAQKDRWGMSGVNNYQITVSIIDPPDYIRSGMNASIRIIVKREKSVLQIPVQSMMEVDDEIYCIVQKEEGWEKRKIKTGTVSSDSACIIDGLLEGEKVVMNPRAFSHLIEDE